MGYRRFEKYGGVFQCSNELFEMYNQHSGSEPNTYSDLLLTYYFCYKGKHPNGRTLEWLESEGLKLVDGNLNLEEYENSVEFLKCSLFLAVRRNDKNEMRKLLNQLKNTSV